MRKFIIAAVLLASTSIAFAQQVPAPSSNPQDQLQALSGQIIDEMQQVLQWRTKAIADEAQIAQLQAQVKDLQAQLDKLKPAAKK